MRIVLVGDTADAADDWIAEHISAVDVCVTSGIPLASRCLKQGARVGTVSLPTGSSYTATTYCRYWRSYHACRLNEVDAAGSSADTRSVSRSVAIEFVHGRSPTVTETVHRRVVLWQ